MRHLPICCCTKRLGTLLWQNLYLPAINQTPKGTSMKTNLKALLLSALVLPGLGQLYKGEKIKGAVIICLVNVFLLAALFLVLQGAGQIIAGKAVGATDPAALLA